MKQGISEEEQKILHDCICRGKGDALIARYWDMVYHTVRKTLELRHVRFTTQDMEDLRNEVFVQLFDKGYKKLRQYKPGAGLGLTGWIRLVAGQTVKMYLRKKDRHGILGENKLLSGDDLIQEIAGKAPESQLDAREKLRRVMGVIETLPSQERLVLKLHFFDGLTLAQIADFTHKEMGNIYAIKSRGVKRLKEKVLSVRC